MTKEELRLALKRRGILYVSTKNWTNARLKAHLKQLLEINEPVNIPCHLKSTINEKDEEENKENDHDESDEEEDILEFQKDDDKVEEINGKPITPLDTSYIHSGGELIWWLKFQFDNHDLDTQLWQDNGEYFNCSCEEAIYNHGFADGNCWIYAMILCNKNFAHDIVQFKNPRKDINEIAFITRTFIRFRMFLNELNKNLIKIYFWWKFGKNQCDVDLCFDEDKILAAIRKEQKNFDLVISEEKLLFTSDVTLL